MRHTLTQAVSRTQRKHSWTSLTYTYFSLQHDLLSDFVFWYYIEHIMIAIAQHTRRLFVRNQYLHIRVIVGILGIVSSTVIAQLAINDQSKVIIDFGMSIIEIWWVLIALFVGSSFLDHEIKNQTLPIIFNHYPSKSGYFIGRYLWLLSLRRSIRWCMVAVFFITMSLYGLSIDSVILASVWTIALKISILLARVMLLSTCSSPFVTFVASLVIYLAGHSMGFVVFYLTQFQEASVTTQYLVTGLYYLLPNFSALSIKDQLLNPFLQINLLDIMRLTMSSLSMIILLLLVSVWIFEHKEIQ